MSNSQPHARGPRADEDRVELNSCDTMVALPGATANGQTIFAKNSDRPANECQPLVMRPGRRHASGSVANCQFVDVEQAPVTYRHVGSRPWWCYGYEHGFNGHQVVIGNESLPSKLGHAPDARLIGMEVLRLALERARTAGEAVEVITGLVSRYGQGKFDNPEGVRTYDNIYLVADPREAYVVEAVSFEWAVKRVNGFGSISNVGMLGADADRVSESAPGFAENVGLWDPADGSPFTFIGAFGDTGAAASGIARQCRSETLLGLRNGRIDVRTMMSVISDHSSGEYPDEPFVEDVEGDVSLCVHRRGPNPASTAASVVADLCADGSRLPVYWCGMYSPCMTLFQPIFIDGQLPSVLGIGDESPSHDSPWWLFHELTNYGLRAGAEQRAEIRATWRPLQEELLQSAYDIATRAAGLKANGEAAKASIMLGSYMAENTRRMLETARGLLANVGAAVAVG